MWGHIHCSLWAGDKNLFEASDSSPSPVYCVLKKLTFSILLFYSYQCLSQGKDNISDLALQFLGGVLAKAPSFCAVTNPTVNSYKRPRGFNPKKKT